VEAVDVYNLGDFAVTPDSTPTPPLVKDVEDMFPALRAMKFEPPRPLSMAGLVKDRGMREARDEAARMLKVAEEERARITKSAAVDNVSETVASKE
jgi:hypothetical protein